MCRRCCHHLLLLLHLLLCVLPVLLPVRPMLLPPPRCCLLLLLSSFVLLLRCRVVSLALSSSARKQRAAHFQAHSTARRKIMSSPLEKELRKKYNVRTHTAADNGRRTIRRSRTAGDTSGYAAAGRWNETSSRMDERAAEPPHRTRPAAASLRRAAISIHPIPLPLPPPHDSRSAGCISLPDRCARWCHVSACVLDWILRPLCRVPPPTVVAALCVALSVVCVGSLSSHPQG